MATDDGAGDGTIDVEVSNHEFRTHASDALRAARVETTRESKRRVIGNLDCLSQVFRLDHDENGAEDFFLRQTRA